MKVLFQKIVSPAVLLFLVACDGGGSGTNLGLLAGALGGASIPVATASDLTNESAADYNDNQWGLITGTRLESWVSDWQNNKPAHITGKLVILQSSLANNFSGDTSGRSYIKSDNANGVYVYHLDDFQSGFRFNQQRDTGLIKNSVRYQADGATVDLWLKFYGIDLSKDLVVFAVGTANNNGTAYSNGSQTQDVTRGIYWLRYWGADIKHLAILNGDIRVNFTNATYLDANKDTAPLDNGGFSVKQLRVDQTIITLTLEDVIQIVKNNGSASIPGITGTQIIVDARPAAQYNQTVGITNSGANHITTAWNDSGAPASGTAGTPKKYVLFETRLKGAKAFPWASLLDASSTGYRFLNKATLAGTFASTVSGVGASYVAGATIVSQCRTNFEAQVNGFAAQNILGYPTVFYDGSLVEWTSLVADYPDGTEGTSFNKLSLTSPFRTDTVDLSYAPSGNINYNSYASGGTSSPYVTVAQADVDPTATTTRKAQWADKAYKY
ncbi:sulfurtransferase [Leptospira wolffii]|uniref:sulfurtransferase n=1 Tax=Leptospira wolffii TaxID=409998 RepID=UPI0010838DF5|nr:sulfurtransferase [Leptospira wolffii]TGK56212.1 sulfurtransferase [Leptospira wolffii]TGK72259.1 sulfurtransferase [Leptospira wolffii]TGK72835.1 sulfurtransferase [Leptospira wolffii]TGL27836.1 sulfurtransferase [Leptospira wolffii]